jgi:riboflavin synthase
MWSWRVLIWGRSSGIHTIRLVNAILSSLKTRCNILSHSFWCLSHSCSICVSGVCLTATQLSNDAFKVGLAPETLKRTYFSTLQPNTLVNLERASEIGGRNSGHFVQGHVDGVGTIVDKYEEGDSLHIVVQTTPDIMKYIVEKGFIAIDGTSLTVVSVHPAAQTFQFMLVEYTQKKIIVPLKTVGEKVNIEVDVLGKYSESALAAILPRLEALEAKVASLERELAEKSPNPIV